MARTYPMSGFVRAVSAIAVLLSVTVRGAAGQETFSNAGQVKRLNEVFGTQGAVPAKLVEVSRLLSEPKDQVAWLVERAVALDSGETTTLARELADLTDQRADGWSKLGVGGLEPLRERLKDIGKTKPIENANENDNKTIVAPAARLMDITDPQALAARLANANDSDFVGLSAADKATLWARGVPNGRLGINTKGKLADWDISRNLVFDLGLGKDQDGNGPLGFVALFAKQDQLRTARDAARGGPPFADAALSAAQELVAMALGLGASANAGRAAATLEQNNAWAWAAIARLAEAAAPGGDRAAALRSARAHLKSIQVVRDARPDGAVHVASLIETWITRLESGSPATRGDSIEAFDSSKITARRANKAALAKQCEAAAPGEQKFKLMQQAKAAEVEPESAVQTVTTDDLKKLLRNSQVEAIKPGMHLFLELLEVDSGRYIGMALGSTTGGRDAKDDFFAPRWLGPASAESVLGDALKCVKGGDIPNEAMIIVAPDGAARCAGWAGEGMLTQRLKAPSAWVLYVPSAAALKKGGGWKPAEVLRFFYYAGNNASTFSAGLSGLAPKTFKSPWLDSNMGLLLVGVGGEIRDHTNPTGFCERLMKAKGEGRAAGVFAVGYSK